MVKTYTIEQWIKDVLIKPRSKLGGNAICPFLKQHLRQIQIVKTKDFSKAVAQSVDLMGPLGLEAVILYGKKWDYDKLMSRVEQWNSTYVARDIEILAMHPDTVDPPLPYEYNYPEWPLVIVQKRSTLHKARNELAKNTNYYNIYDQSNK